MCQIKKNSIKTRIQTSDTSIYAIYKSLNTWREEEIGKAFLEKICQELMAWAEEPNSLKMTQFMREYGIPESTFYFWVKKHSEFRQAYWYALTAIGDRREIGALKREYDAGTVDKTISHYCSVNAAAEERRAKLKREEQGSSLEDLTNCVQKLVEQKWGDDDKEQKD